jgi:NADH:ubiquinone oxidoreductase subunit C
MDIEALVAQVRTARRGEQRADGWWLEDPDLDVEAMSRAMVASQCRLATITAIPDAEDEYRLAYHWDCAGRLLTFVTLTHAQSIPSIAALCPAADWIEREIHDYFAISFSGREGIPPLVLRAADRAGIFSWNGHSGGAR